MTVIQSIMDFVARNTLRVVFSLVFFVALFVKAMYHFQDYPYFTANNLCDIICGLSAFFALYIIFAKKDTIQQRINYKICFVIFMLCSIAYILLVPLTPFSDMKAVYEGAITFSKFQWDTLLEDPYWNMFPGNIRLAVMWGIFIMPFPKSLFTIKLVNALFLYITVALTRELAKEFRLKYYNLVYLLLLTFVPLFLYINHVYYDMPMIMFILLALYVFKKYDNVVGACAILGVARYIRKNVLIFFVAVIIIYILDNKEVLFKKKGLKKLSFVIAGIVLFIIISDLLSGIVKDRFITGNFQSYPSWNQIYIGINEEEFGFMDNDFSYDRDAGDVIERVIEYGPIRMTKILTKKTFWLWSQGTYQAQRYAFGSDVAVSEEKFQYETFATKLLLNDNQIVRRIINSFMRAQYFVLFGLMLILLWKEKDVEKYRIIYYIIIATLLSMLVFELKSRYILSLLPLMCILSVAGIDILDDFIEDKKQGFDCR